MKTFNFLLAVTAVALLCVAGINTTYSQAPTFDIGDGEGNTLGEVSFPVSDNEESTAESTCAMTPNGPGLPSTVELPNEIPRIEPPYYQPDISESPVRFASARSPSALPSPNYRNDNPPGGGGDEPDGPPPPSPNVPEPGTMLILGIGLCAASATRVIRRKK